MNDEQFCKNIQDEINEDLGLTRVDYECKISNINTFLHINREGLKNGKLEKRLLMYKSLADESIYIEYPGKESTPSYANKRGKNTLNPNDFRPELHTKEEEI